MHGEAFAPNQSRGALRHGPDKETGDQGRSHSSPSEDRVLAELLVLANLRGSGLFLFDAAPGRCTVGTLNADHDGESEGCFGWHETA